MTISSTPDSDLSPRKPFLSLQLRLMLALSLSFLLLLLLLYGVLLKVLETQQLSQAQADLQHVLLKVVDQVDTSEVGKLYTPDGQLISDYERDAGSLKSFSKLADIGDTDQRAFPFAYVKQGNNFKLIASSTGKAGMLPNSPDILAAGLNPASQGMSITATPLHQNGYFLIGTAPIRNSVGRVICAMGVKFKIDYVYGVFAQFKERSIQLMIILYSILLLLFSYISRRFSKPVAVLAREMQTVKDGDYQRDFNHLRRGAFGDEVSTLTEVFEDLLNRVSSREEHLVQEVQAMRVEIDLSKREEQVAEIVESEGFVDIRERARQMRERRAKTNIS